MLSISFLFLRLKRKEIAQRKEKERCYKAKRKVLCLNRSNGFAIARAPQEKASFLFLVTFSIYIKIKEKK